MLWIDLLLRWLHIINAVVLGGGVLFWRFAFFSGASLLPAAARTEAFTVVRARWSKLVAASSGLLLITGLVNFFLILQRYDFDKAVFPGNMYHAFFGIKFLLSMAVFLLAALLAGRTSAADKLRQNERLWLNVTVVLVIAVICLGGLLRAAPRQSKTAQSLQAAPVGGASMVNGTNEVAPGMIGD